jgi:carbon monoxide dehydrogenase subunit G
MTLGEIAGVAHQLRGRVRLRLQGQPSPQVLHSLQTQLSGAVGVRHVRVSEAASSIVIEFDPAQQSVEQLLRLQLNGAAPERTRTRVDESTLLQAPAEQVWSLLGDPSAAASHLPAVLKIREDAPGSWRVTLDLLGQRVEGRVVLLEEIAAQRLVLALNGAVTGRFVLSLTPEGEETRVREQVHYDLSDALLNLTLGRMAEPAIRRLVRQHLASIRELLERTAE